MRGAPLANSFFRPEEKHVASGENNVVPPLGRGNKAMEKPAAGGIVKFAALVIELKDERRDTATTRERGERESRQR